MSYDLLPTPVPNEFMVRVWASAQQVIHKIAGLSRGVTTLAEFDLATAPVSEFGSYVYWDCEGPDAQGRLGFLFVKVRSTEEIAVAFEEFTTEDDQFWWPPILEKLEIYANNDNPNWPALVTDRQAYLLIMKKRERPSFRGVTRIVVRRYWSHVPWAEEDLASAPMQPNTVEYDLCVLRSAVKDCLHGAIKVPGLAGDGGAGRLYNLSDADPGSTEAAAYPARNYDATTPYTTWVDHIFKSVQRPLRGGYLLETYEALAPPLTDIEET